MTLPSVKFQSLHIPACFFFRMSGSISYFIRSHFKKKKEFAKKKKQDGTSPHSWLPLAFLHQNAAGTSSSFLVFSESGTDMDVSTIVHWMFFHFHPPYFISTIAWYCCLQFPAFASWLPKLWKMSCQRVALIQLQHLS